MKKTTTLLLALLCFAGTINAQSNYTVIKVMGNISFQASGKTMTQGDVFSPRDQLVFKSAESKAAVINPEKGRFMIAPPTADKLTTTASFVPAMSNVSSRAGMINNLVDLQNNFSGNYLIIDKVLIKISAAQYPMNDTSFFFIRYKYNGQEINKKLSFKGDSLIIDQSTLLMVDNKPITAPDENSMKLFYFSSQKATLINEFIPVFPDISLLKPEISIIINQYKGQPSNVIFDQVSSYLNDFYGKPNEDNIKTWLKASFGIM